jgi:hypothetical protein
MQRIRKEPEPVSSPGVGAVTRVRRESDRFRTDILTSDGGSISGQRNTPSLPIIREVKIRKTCLFNFLFCSFKKTKIYRLPQYANSSGAPGSISNENKGLLLAAGNYLNFLSIIGDG